jgi:hypothetical protein
MNQQPVFRFGDRIQYGGKVVGCYARRLRGDGRCVVLWKVYHEYQDSYSTSVGLLNQIDDDVEYLYMYDKNTKELFKFKRDTYEKHETNPHDEDQKSPHVAHNIGHWKNGEEIIEHNFTIN